MIDFKLNKELVITLVFLVFIIICGFWSIAVLTPLVLVILYKLFKDKRTSYSFTILDLSFLSILLSETLTVLFSVNANNGSLTSFNMYVMLFLYAVYKGYFKSPRKKTLFSMNLIWITVN